MAISYKSYCWVMGTTSFRTAQLNRKIEEQIRILHEFRSLPGHMKAQWDNGLQAAYYDFMKSKGFVNGDAARPDKDAREKTSGLVELGLVDEERKITFAGKRLLAITETGDFSRDKTNLLELSRDSDLYLRQLLKASKNVGDNTVRPFVVFLDLISKIRMGNNHKRFLKEDEFTYLLPLCINPMTTKLIASRINEARRNNSPVDIDAVVFAIMMNMENYQEAMKAFVSSDSVTKELLCLVGMNRKSGANGMSRYDEKYKFVYDALHKTIFDGPTERNLGTFLSAIQKLSINIARQWKAFFFNVDKGRQIRCPLLPKFRKRVSNASETHFRKDFFKVMHLLKAKANLEDYCDLNKRYFALSDCIVFQEEGVFLDALPAILFEGKKNWTATAAYKSGENIEDDTPITTIFGSTLPSKGSLVMAATGMSATTVDEKGGVDAVLKAIRYKNFANVLDSRFTKDKVSELLRLIEDRSQDAVVQQMVTDDADIPTIFEYLVAIAWYYISDRKGDVLEYMNLSLGANFLPKTHAGGGEADIVWHYKENPPCYHEHTLLIEVTVSERDSQRRMEMEPVSRHLGDYLLEHSEEPGTYCTFVATHLNPNVISDFRGKRQQIYYDSKDASRHIQGMKIIPIDTATIRGILANGLRYVDLHGIFEKNYCKDTEPWQWYQNLHHEVCGAYETDTGE